MTPHPSLDLLCINRPCDADRRDAFLSDALALGHDPRLVEAVDREDRETLAEHAALLPPTFWESDEIKPGAFACFLSHRRAWAEAALSRAPWTLICEDDARLLVSPEAAAAEAARAARAGHDMVFAGARACAFRAAAAALDPASARGEAQPEGGPAGALAAALGRLDRGALPKAPGAEAMLVSRRGARRLLALSFESRACAGVDWLLLYFCADGTAPGASGPELSALRRMLGRGASRLTGGIAAAPLAACTGAPSVLGHAETVPIAALAGGASFDERSPVAPPTRARYTASRSTRSSAG